MLDTFQRSKTVRFYCQKTKTEIWTYLHIHFVIHQIYERLFTFYLQTPSSNRGMLYSCRSVLEVWLPTFLTGVKLFLLLKNYFYFEIGPVLGRRWYVWLKTKVLLVHGSHTPRGKVTDVLQWLIDKGTATHCQQNILRCPFIHHEASGLSP